MDITSVVALVVAAVVLGGIFWLAVYSRKENQKHTGRQVSNRPNLNRREADRMKCLSSLTQLSTSSSA
ncbi:MAG TPA: hypothetical protein VFP47_02615 [Pyrinomonadaceae bacterium]|nr:hypothetical protein [Pyrinomonadaceae bacterium]